MVGAVDAGQVSVDCLGLAESGTCGSGFAQLMTGQGEQGGRLQVAVGFPGSLQRPFHPSDRFAEPTEPVLSKSLGRLKPGQVGT